MLAPLTNKEALVHLHCIASPSHLALCPKFDRETSQGLRSYTGAKVWLEECCR